MADELPEVRQVFEADVLPYLAAIEDAVHEAKDFAEANREASSALDDLFVHSDEVMAAEHGLAAETKDARDAMLEEAAAARAAADETGKLRDQAAEAAVALGAEGLAADSAAAGEAAAGAAAAAVSMGDALVVLIPLAVGLAVALFPLIATLPLIAIGFTGLAAVAVPEISKVWAAVSKGGAALKALSPQERALVGPIESLRDEFGRLQKAVQPEILAAFASGLRIIKDLMPALKPLIVAAGHALDGFLKNIDSWLRSSSGQKFIHWMAVDGPHALAEFGKALWTTAQVVGRTFDFIMNVAETMRRNWFRYMHDLSEITDNFRIGFTQMGHLIESIWNQTVGFIINTRGAVLLSWFRSLPGRILGALGDLGSLLWNAGLSLMRGLLSGLEAGWGDVKSFVGSIGGWIASLKGPLPKDLTLLVPHGQAIMQGLMHGIASQVPALRAQMGLVTGTVGLGGVPALGYAGGLGGAGSGGAAAGGGGNVYLTVNGWVGNDQQLAQRLRDELLEFGVLNPTSGLWPLRKGHIR